MAEYCLDCLNKYMEDKKLREQDVVTAPDFCEDCGEWKSCVITIKKSIARELLHRIFP